MKRLSRPWILPPIFACPDRWTAARTIRRPVRSAPSCCTPCDERQKSRCCLSGSNCIAKASEASASSTCVHPCGRPISASTNSGHRTAAPDPSGPTFPVVWLWRVHQALIASVRVVPGCITPVDVVERAVSFASVVHGVGQLRTSPSSVGFPRGNEGPLSAPPASGVGQVLTTSRSLRVETSSAS